MDRFKHVLNKTVTSVKSIECQLALTMRNQQLTIESLYFNDVYDCFEAETTEMMSTYLSNIFVLIKITDLVQKHPSNYNKNAPNLLFAAILLIFLSNHEHVLQEPKDAKFDCLPLPF